MNKIDLNKALKIFFSNALKIGISSPSQAFSFFKTILWLGKAARLRAKWKREKIHVPPIIIFSITDQCNMDCKGCYDRAIHTSDEKEISSEKLRSIIHEAKELGVSFFVIAGGEPFLRPEILDITKDFPQIIFLIFTNGILIESNEIDTLKKQKNILLDHTLARALAPHSVWSWKKHTWPTPCASTSCDGKGRSTSTWLTPTKRPKRTLVIS